MLAADSRKLEKKIGYEFKDKALLIIPVYVFATGVLGAMGSMISTVVLFVPLGSPWRNS